MTSQVDALQGGGFTLFSVRIRRELLRTVTQFVDETETVEK